MKTDPALIMPLTFLIRELLDKYDRAVLQAQVNLDAAWDAPHDNGTRYARVSIARNELDNAQKLRDAYADHALRELLKVLP